MGLLAEGEAEARPRRGRLIRAAGQARKKEGVVQSGSAEEETPLMIKYRGTSVCALRQATSALSLEVMEAHTGNAQRRANTLWKYAQWLSNPFNRSVSS